MKVIWLMTDKKSETCFLSLKFQLGHGRKYGRINSSKSKKLCTMVRLWPGSQGPLEEGQPGALSAAFSGEGYAGAPGLAADPCGTPDLYRSEYLWYTKPLYPLIVLWIWVKTNWKSQTLRLILYHAVHFYQSLISPNDFKNWSIQLWLVKRLVK